MDENQQKNEGRRVKMTKMLLKQSLISLMRDKSIHAISIKEICQGADINRSTFYRHYNNQYELYDEVLDDISDDIAKIFAECSGGDYTTTLFITKVLEYIEAHREMFLVVLSDKSNISMGETYNRFTNRFINSDTSSEFTIYIVQFVSAGMASFLWTWLNKENRRSAAEVAAIFNTILMHGIKRAMDFSKILKK